MSKIFTNQTKLTINVNVMDNISDVSTALIKYEKPNRERGSFPATVVDPTTGLISYAIQTDQDLNVAGSWKFWAHLTYSDGKIIEGSSQTIIVHPSGS